MIQGVAPALVLLHGFTQTRQSWRRTVRVLGAGRYRALVPDLPGHGQATLRTPSFDACTAYVRALGPERFTLLAVPGQLKRIKVDPWTGYLTVSQRLPTASIKALRQL